MTIQRHFKLALTAGHTIPLVINANQYDSGEQWLFTLYNDGVRYTPSSGAIVGIKADRLGIINTGTVDANGRVVINETRQMTAAVGKNIFELLIDDQTHGTANFMVLVEPRPGDNADLSESDYSLFEEAIQGTSQAAIKAGVQEWMDENLTDPTDPIVDASLSLSGAAADAKKTGDEISALKSALIDCNASNLLDWFASDYVSRTHNGVTYTWDSSYKKCTVSGTANGTSFANLYANTNELPSVLAIGETYRVLFNSTDLNIALEFLFYLNGTTSGPTALRIRESGEVTVPTGCTGFTIRLRVLSGDTANGYIENIQILNAYTNAELSEFADDTKWATNPNAHLLSVGNSILTGSVWKNGSSDHLSEYKNTPYGNVAIALHVPQQNVDHTFLSNAGLMHDAGNGSFLDVIKATDLSGYDYLLTHLWTVDMYRSRLLGSETSTADDGTIAGAVISLITYINTSNSQCQLILVSIPPVKAEDNVFTTIHGNGSSIKDLDALMHKLAKMYHFIYVDWQSLNLSYSYQDYTDNDDIHANNEDTYRVMGEYIGSNIHGEDSTEVITKAEGEFDVISQSDVTVADRTINGVTFTWNSDRECTITGTATTRAINNLYYSTTQLPSNLFTGDYLFVRFSQENTGGTVGFEVVFYDSEASTLDTLKYTKDAMFTIPSDAVGMVMRLYVNADVTIDAVVKRIQVIKVNFKKPDIPLIISFIDDDTSGQDYVEKYHSACLHNGIKGNYAVMTSHIGNDVTAQTLLDYEDEGFGMLTHCYYQSGSQTPYWSDSNRTETVINQCRANLARGLREMRTYGFASYNHFVVPGGHTYPDIFKMARQLGVETAISTANATWNKFADYDHTFIKRVSFEKDDSTATRTLQITKDKIDECVAEGCGWLILTTHFNEWGDISWDETLDLNGYPVGYSRFNEIVQYAISAGLTPMNYIEAWSHFRSLFEANRQLYDRINGEQQ